jgi:hypothetical protein
VNAKRTKGKKPLSTQIDETLHRQFRHYVESRGESITDALERAITREMMYPPPPPPPLPPFPDSPAAGKST